jgi:hypothetical protein
VVVRPRERIRGLFKGIVVVGAKINQLNFTTGEVEVFYPPLLSSSRLEPIGWIPLKVEAMPSEDFVLVTHTDLLCCTVVVDQSAVSN